MEEDAVLTFTVTLTVFSSAGMDGVVSGSASGKLIVFVLKINLARAWTAAFMVRVATARSPAKVKVDPISKARVTIEGMK